MDNDLNMKLLSQNMIKFLQTYNFIKANDSLVKLAEKIKLEEENTTDNDKKSIFNYVNGIIDSEANDIICFLNKKSLKNELNIQTVSTKKKIRIYMDGVFDIIHSGHFNAIRQAKKLGDILVVGVNSDEEVQKVKGPLIMNGKERAMLVSACKWVDEVIEDTPYTPTIELLDQYNIDFCAHGDDIALNAEGESCYSKIEKAGRFKVFKRTEGISTTDITGRLLLVGKEIYKSSLEQTNTDEIISANSLGNKISNIENFELGPVVSKFLTTGWRLTEFCNSKYPKPTDKIVFIDGSFDILHIGHIETLKKAKEMGDFLYVGLHDDKTINEKRGKNYPILNLQERIFNLLSIKYVDDVIIGSPWIIPEDMIKNLKINLVVEGTTTKRNKDEKNTLEDPYLVPKKLGIYQQIESKYSLDTDEIAKRLLFRREHFIKKYENKKKKEDEYYNEKKYLEEI